MEKRKLGNTGIEVFPIAFGGIPIQRVDVDRAVEVVRRAIELGIDLIDTARGYTDSEIKIGKAIKGIQKKVYIATKSGNRTKDGILKDVEISLNNLGVDSIDIYQLHGVNSKEIFDTVMAKDGALEGLKEAKKKGLIKHIGVSSHSTDMILELIDTGEFEVIQLCYNFIENKCEEKILDLARERGIGLIGMKPLGGGMIENARIALKYVLRQGYVIPDPGMESIREVEENVSIARGSYELTEEELEEIERIRKELGSVFCRRCQYCQPCPQGVHISSLLGAKSVVKRLPKERIISGWVYEAYLSGKNCTRCGVCLTKCPYNLPIPDLVEENTAFLERVIRELKGEG
jgi:predicted aldo/keto reductase-like oxidoreductase